MNRIRSLPSATEKVNASNLAWIVTAIRTAKQVEVDLRDHDNVRVLVRK